MTTQRKQGDYVDNSKLTRGELSIFIEDAVAAGYGNDGDESKYPYTGICYTHGDVNVGGRLDVITIDPRGNDVTHEYQGISKQSKDSQENVITGTGVYRCRDNGYDVVIHTINYEEGIAYGYDTQDGRQERYRVKTGDRIGVSYTIDCQGSSVDRKDMQNVDMDTINLGSHSHTMDTRRWSSVINVSIDWADPSKTPAEKQGWTEGDIGIVIDYADRIPVGSVVELHRDDKSGSPMFKDYSERSGGDCKWYNPLGCVKRIGTKQEFLDMFFDTPSKRQGFGLDVYGVVNQENSGTIDAGSVVELQGDTDMSSPLWKVMAGYSPFNCINDGSQGAFVNIHSVTQIPLSKDLYENLSNS